jgi:TatD DNase family protein
LQYIDIHTHTYYQQPDTTLVLNVFPEEQEKLRLPSFFSVGLHPWHVEQDTWEEQTDLVGILSSRPGVLAIGETGLDRVVSVPYNIQRLAFEAQLSIAEKSHKAMIIHCVRSYSEMLAYRKKSDQSVPWIFHWFNSDEQTAAELIRKNCYLSFGHMLFNEQSKSFRVFKNLPLQHIFLETDDAGYSIAEIYTRAAQLKNDTPEEIKTQIIHNFDRCFKIR